ncbi:beta-1,3-galactosyltransferase 1-like [Mizuhopecten yessoensis]|uniref:beta-1,3-galactosyltransferase 1-like n=1 Tax=Mizuhopecten yessoensis TaxID=6573 RepID=UPI000B4588F1|nr:beta-1,3-galactosyltransferase 1-like [Mizuhopecten yessoensis]XP_021372292.1 beta-1,3-galactosyltransferase 1-like [Mizuhopecten yessoensis]XP_021372294.1 beta-1,3-galactosyltransferase 1-like [Mizuhopecten yessoensis]XP_021372295.1 beta-1,3-galactosyltransferase 1-like [Mizuhopecten yessoensis]
MSRMKIRRLYLVLIAVFIFIFLFFIMASNVTSFSSEQRRIMSPSRSSSLQQYRFSGQEIASVEKNETNNKMTSIRDTQIVATNSTETKKIEIKIDTLQRIESLLSDIKRRQEVSDNAQEASKKLTGEKFLGERSISGNNLVSSDLHERSEDLNSNMEVPKSTDTKSKLFQLRQRNDISPVIGEKELSQKNQFKQDNELLGKIQGMLDEMVSKKMSENGVQLFKQLNTTKPLKGTSSKLPSDSSSRLKVCDSCFKNDFKFLTNPESLCKHSGDLDLLIAISTAPMNREARDAIRKTWASTSMMSSGNMRSVFFIGVNQDKQMQMQLDSESQQYHDIVQLQFKDSYSNLTYKTLSELRWVSEFCTNTKYVMKTDSDMFVNTFLLPNILKGAPKTNFIGGDCWGPSPPHREQSSKWYVSYKSYRHSSFPPMCSGTGYLMSKDLVLNILQMSKNIPFFHLEDVFIALCTKKLNVKPVYLNGFSNMRTQYDDCTYRYKVATSHEISPTQLVRYWSDMQRCELKLEELGYDPRQYMNHPI